MIPNDPRKPNETSGIRIGTAAITTRGMKEPEMERIADCIYSSLIEEKPNSEVLKTVQDITEQFPLFYKGAI